ncbi:glycoside hydrolase family 3 protein [Aplosporella prunicola CBS 121167]|uniref:Glycoside hydrolase family 3 protein n=1 Tax=Aplosporella prunicola CBS 121167 TaxID=1176127 RepID=A0A6A6BXJ0_9PEZI|nr:glycoside hydrolase family 3 protein [Aplosporella prunicola CBS 121167]KAF2147574.1 glycoside hydrolase family 3 protein [Aplosporella prunicola CBS 121167]
MGPPPASDDDDALRRRIGRLCIVGFHGLTPDAHIKTLIRAPYYVGQIVLFQRNVHDAHQLACLTRDLQRLAQEAGHKDPLIIAIDQENGLVTRIQPPIAAQLSGPMALGATACPQYAQRVAEATGMSLRALGINMNYAPVCDVNNNPDNPVIGVRSFSDNPHLVGRMAHATWNGLARQGVISCVKHFPGHGDTAVDSHYGLPKIEKSWDELEECELVPFRRAVTGGCPAVMTAHIIFGSQQSDLPATLNREVLQLLREDLGFDGVIISDCLEMNAIRTECGGTVKGAVTALRSGCDCVMICHTMELQQGALEAIYKEAREDESFRMLIDKSCARVTDKCGGALAKFAELQGSDASTKSTLEDINRTNVSLADEVYAKTTTIVRSEPGALPVKKDAPVLFVSPMELRGVSGVISYGNTESSRPHKPLGFIDFLRSHHPQVKEMQCYDNPETIQQVLAAAEDIKHSHIILATRNARLAPYQRELAEALAELVEKKNADETKLIVVATCDPYDFLEDERFKTYITTYEPTSPALQAAADAIFGVFKPEGRLPVAVNGNASADSPSGRLPAEDFESDNEGDMERICDLWHELLPTYQVPETHLAYLLRRPGGRHYVVRDAGGPIIGFIATLTHGFAAEMDAEPKASIAALLVDRDWQNRGIGTKLLEHARKELGCSSKSVSIGSAFPRFFPGLPLDIPSSHQEFFQHRGFLPGVLCRDLFMPITDFTIPADILAPATAQGFTFTPWTPADEAASLAIMRRNFSTHPGWCEAFATLADRGLHRQAMVARAPSGEQVGWALMLEPGLPVWQELALPPLCGEATGLLACVGVDEPWRKRGVGLAMSASAVADLRARGVKGVFVDWVELRGWYERLGFATWREYRGMEWRKAGP